MVYELIGIANSNDPELEVRPENRGLAELTWAASKCFEAGDLEGAARRYLEILKHFPNDGVATSMLSTRSLSKVPAHPA